MHLARRVMALSIVLASVPLIVTANPHVVGAVAQPSGNAQPTVETDPVANSGDAADDPAIWLNPADPSQSVVIGSDNAGALEVYDLTGHRIQRITEGNFGNVDVRHGFMTANGPQDIVVVYRAGIRVYAIDPTTRLLSNITDASAGGSITVPFTGDGLCLYRSAATGSTYAFVNSGSGRVAQYELTDSDHDGLVEGTVRRDWDVGTGVEGCVADDQLGDFYISEETVGIWKYGAEPGDGTGTTDRTLVDGTVANGGHIMPDAEGLTIVDQPGGSGYLMASSQAGSDTASSYLVYERQGANAFVRSFKVTASASVDGCSRTDGIDALAADMGPAFPNGIFVCQDNDNTAPNGGNQNFKFVPLERVVGLTTPVPPPTTTTAPPTTTTVTTAPSGAQITAIATAADVAGLIVAARVGAP